MTSEGSNQPNTGCTWPGFFNKMIGKKNNHYRLIVTNVITWVLTKKKKKKTVNFWDIFEKDREIWIWTGYQKYQGTVNFIGVMFF